MSTKAATLQAEKKEKSGKGAARQLRREGRVPAVIYGKGSQPISLSLSADELRQQYLKGRFSSRVFHLSLDGKELQVLPREVQTHPVSDKIEHVDFLQVDDNTLVRVFVPVKFLNVERCIGVKKGGALNAVRRSIEFFCKPVNIPANIEVDVKDMHIGDSLHVEDINLPEGISPVIKRNFTIATIAGRLAQAVEPGDEAAAGEAAEGDAPATEGAEAAEGGEGSAEGSDN